MLFYKKKGIKMKHTIKETDKKVVIKIEENALYDAFSTSLKDLLTQFSNNTDLNIELDLSMVRTIDSSGIGKILLFYKHLKGKKRELIIQSLSPDLKEVFLTLRLNRLFNF